jgi:hypothetical protein
LKGGLRQLTLPFFMDIFCAERPGCPASRRQA